MVGVGSKCGFSIGCDARVRLRLIAALVGLTLIVLLVHDVPLARYLRTVETDRIVTALERDSFFIAGKSEEALEEPDEGTLGTLWAAVNTYSQSSGARVIVTNKNGVVITASNGNEYLGASYSARPEIQQALKGEVASGTRFSTTLNESIVFVAVPVLNGSNILGTVRSTFPSRVVDQAVSARIRGILTVAGITLIMAIFVAILLANSVIRRLKNLLHVTDEFTQGDYEIRANEHDGAPEIRTLATSFNAMATQLTTLLRQQQAFAGDASHQLRTPLTALQLRLEQAADLVATNPKAAGERIEAAMLETDRLQRLVESLLTLSRTHNLAKLETSTVDLAAIIHNRIDTWIALADEHDVTISLEIPATLLVTALPDAVEQIVDNYLDNALEVSPKHSTIVITVTSTEDVATLHVKDEGPGMAEGDLDKAFNRFWRGRSDIHGSGLGLAIVQRLAIASGGIARLVNRPDKGLDAQVEFLLAPKN